MEQKLLCKLSEVTEEEKQILAGKPVSKAVYTTGHTFEVDSARMLAENQLVSVRPHTRFAPFPKHSHNFVEVMYVCQGKITHIIDGKDTVVLKQGELLFLSCNASHAIQKAGAADIAVNFIALPQFFDYALELIGTSNPLGSFIIGCLQPSGGETNYLHYTVADVAPVQNIVEVMVWDLVNKGSRQVNSVSMGLLMMYLLDCTGQMESGRETSAIVTQALLEIQSNYKDASLGSVAKRFRVTPGYISQEVKKATGITFKQLLQQKRLAIARYLLAQTDMSIQDIVHAVGYDNTSYFYKIFKQDLGIGPKEYRNSLDTMPK